MEIEILYNPARRSRDAEKEQEMKVSGIKVKSKGVEILYRNAGFDKAVLVELPDKSFAAAMRSICEPGATVLGLPTGDGKRIALATVAVKDHEPNKRHKANVSATLSFKIGGCLTSNTQGTFKLPRLWFIHESYPATDNEPERVLRCAMPEAFAEAIESALSEAEKTVELIEKDGAEGGDK